MRTLILFTLIAIAFTTVSGRILNVPDQFPTIQTGIDSSANGDTVLVANGRYFERINFRGREILLSSLFLFTSDTLDIQNTIIDGDTLQIGNPDTSSVLRFINQESEFSIIQGFTITHGMGTKINLTMRVGGGIFCYMSNPTIRNNFVSDNGAYYGGAIYCDNARPTILNNTIFGNAAPHGGGYGSGIYCYYDSHCTILDNLIRDNLGGAIACIHSSPLIEGNTIIRNNYNLYGAGIYCEGSRPQILNNIICQNTASSGGAISLSYSNPTIINNTISRNIGSGAIKCINGAAPTIINSIIYGNTSPQISGTPSSITFSDIESGWEGIGNMDENPLFLDPNNGNYNLCSQSPCINAGDPDIFDPDSTRSDMGYFFQDHIVCDFGILRYVSVSGSDSTGNGSFGNPFRSIQHGIGLSFINDTVVVLNGIYYESIDFMGKSITVASNYIFSSDTLDINNTIIDADSSGSVVNMDFCSSDAELLGFTLQNGYSSTGGGGIHCSNSNGAIIHNIIKNCGAYGSPAAGGGIYFSGSNSLVENNIIYSCRAGYGGGIYCTSSNITIRNNSILGNVATTAGGGIDCENYSSPFIVNNIIDGNIAHASGTAGGGIHINSGSHGISSPIIINNVISNNIIDYSGSGGCTGAGISSIDANTKILFNSIYNNISSASGAGIYAGGAYSDTILGNLIYNNSARNYGAGIHGGTTIRTLIASNTICNNISENSGGILSGNLELKNNTIWYNSLPQMTGSPVVSYCNIEGGWTGQGNINEIPQFVNPDSFNYNICDDSPCLNAGDPSLQDPDGTRSDIGVYFPTHPECRPVGQIFNISTTGNDSTGDGSNLNPFRTIQYGWTRAREHDTVFVHQGTFIENPILTRKRANIVSNYAYSNDTLDIQNTIIDGDSLGPTITFSFTDSLLSFTGFTIIHGLGSGIRMDTSGSQISHCIIRDNWGSGIECYGWARPNIFDNQIKNNISDSLGGGILCINSRIANIRNNKVYNNSAFTGGGIYCKTSNPAIKNNEIYSNNALSSGGGIYSWSSSSIIDSNSIFNNSTAGKGGGIMNYSTVTPITNNVIIGNSGKLGAGLYFQDYQSVARNNLIRRNFADSVGGGIYATGYWQQSIANTIDSNSAIYAGGGIYHSTSGSGNIESNTISYNRSKLGGGIYGSCTIRANNIINNVADSIGGGVAIDGFSTPVLELDSIFSNTANYGGGLAIINRARPSITNCYFAQNNSIVDGGAVWISNASFRFRGNKFLHNSAGHNGGALYLDPSPKDTLAFAIIDSNWAGNRGGGIFCTNSWPHISNTLITRNHSLCGGGLFTDHANPTLMNTVFYGNSADSIAGGLYLGDGSSPVIRNSIFWGDSAVYGNEVRADSNTQRLISYSNIQGGLEGDNNIDVDPLFRNPVNGDFYLMSTACGDSLDSPCIDTGSPADFDSLLSCSWGLGTTRSDMGIYGGGRWQPVGVDDDQPPDLPLTFSLSQNYPNPFNPATTIKYDLPSACRVRIDIYDILGRRVATLENEEQAAGSHQAIWNAQDKSSGIYFYRIRAGEFIETRKMMLMK